jgi:predicted nicotinamide N-methyase
MTIAARLETFVAASTHPTPVALTPEIRLDLAKDSHGIFQAAERLKRPGERFQPYWSFAWPGGQAMARYLLDHPDEVRGRSVIDIGAGSGITAIAAALAGASSVLAVDVDPLSEIAIRRNADTNGVTISTTTVDMLGTVPGHDLILIADLLYEPELQTRVAAFLAGVAANGSRVLMADRTTGQRPPAAFTLLKEYAAPLTPELQELHFERARVWEMKPRDLRGVKRRESAS